MYDSAQKLVTQKLLQAETPMGVRYIRLHASSHNSPSLAFTLVQQLWGKWKCCSGSYHLSPLTHISWALEVLDLYSEKEDINLWFFIAQALLICLLLADNWEPEYSARIEWCVELAEKSGTRLLPKIILECNRFELQEPGRKVLFSATPSLFIFKRSAFMPYWMHPPPLFFFCCKPQNHIPIHGLH